MDSGMTYDCGLKSKYMIDWKFTHFCCEVLCSPAVEWSAHFLIFTLLIKSHWWQKKSNFSLFNLSKLPGNFLNFNGKFPVWNIFKNILAKFSWKVLYRVLPEYYVAVLLSNLVSFKERDLQMQCLFWKGHWRCIKKDRKSCTVDPEKYNVGC